MSRIVHQLPKTLAIPAQSRRANRLARAESCPAISQKIFRFALPPNQTYNFRRPASTRGAYRDRHGRGARDAVDAAASAREVIAGRVFVSDRPARRRRRCSGRRSRVVLAPVAGVKSRGGFVGPTGRVKPFNPRGDGGKKELVSGESSKEAVKTITQGRPDDPAPPVLTTVCFLPMHTGRGCEPSTRPSLRPLSSEGQV